MKNEISRLCGGYYRSFSRFKKCVGEMDESMVFLQKCASFLLEEDDENVDELKRRFTHLFFEEYGKRLAGNCGCSNLIFDHQRIRVKQPRVFVDLLSGLYFLNLIDCNIDQFARAIYAVFDTGYTFETLQKKLHTDTYLSDELYTNIKSLLDKLTIKFPDKKNKTNK